ncbi:MAG TPA: glycosyltransferase family 2 protein [Polyangia bacterium]|nr:glycosyltransferase family 2 protein [Polyangia bacterium]
MKLSIIVPAFNEARTLAALLAAVRAVDLGGLGLEREILVVSDGSTDGSAAIARAQVGVAVHEYHPNRGKGAAVRHGLAHASGDLILIQDADLEYDPQDYLALLPPLCDGRAQVVYGSRLLGYEKQFGKGTVRRHPGAYRSAYLGGRAVTGFTNLLYGTHLTDAPTCYKCFRADVLRAITIEHERFDWEQEVTAKIARSGIEIFEVPISYRPRSFQEGKKIGVRDGLSALWTLARYRTWRPDGASLGPRRA